MPEQIIPASYNEQFIRGLKVSMSDTLCGFSTDTAITKRALFTDMGVINIKIKRPVMINGIDDMATRGDLASRSLLINLPTITNKKDNTTIWQAFNNDYPYIFGALLSRLSTALNNIDTVKIDNSPRMLDFAKWTSASESQDIQGEFMQAYKRNINQATYKAIESSTFANTVCTLMSKLDRWTGTAAELLVVLDNKVSDRVRNSRNWIDSPEKVSSQLRRYQSLFRKIGIVISKGKLKGQRVIVIEKV